MAITQEEDLELPVNQSRNSSFRHPNPVSGVSRGHQGKNKRTASARQLLVILKSSWTLIIEISFSCVIAVIVDPLFLYLPILDEKRKCIGMDTKLRKVALILRSLTDIGVTVHMIHKFREAVRETRIDLANLSKNEKGKTGGKPNRDERSTFAKALAAWMLSWSSIVIDFFALLPIPQVVIVAVRSSRYLDQRKTWLTISENNVMEKF